MTEFALNQLKTQYSAELKDHPALQQLAHKWEDVRQLSDDVVMAEECKTVYLKILAQQREWLLKKNKTEQTLDEDIIRKHLRYLDLEEEKLRYI